MRTGNARAWVSLAVAVAVAAGAAFAIRAWRHHARESLPATAAGFKAATVIPAAKLPGGPYAILTIPDFAGFHREAAATDLGLLLHDPALRAKARAAAGSAAASPLLARALAALSLLDDLEQLRIESVVGGVFPLPGDAGPSSAVGLALRGGDGERVLTWLDSKLETSVGSRRDFGDVACFDESLCRRLRHGTVVIGSPRAALDVIDAVVEAADHERVVAATKRVRTSPSAITVFIDVHTVTEALNQRLPAAGRSPWLMKVGAGAVDYLVYAQVAEGRSFRGRLVLGYDDANAGLLGALLEFPLRKATLDQRLPAHYDHVTFGQLDNPAATYERVLAETRELLPEEERGQLDQGLALARGLLGLDLKNDLFATLGGEAGLAYSVTDTAMVVTSPAAALASVRGIATIGVTDMPRLERLLARLEPLASMQGIAIETETVADGKLRTLPIPLPDAEPPAIGLAKNLLVIGTSRDEVRSVLEGAAAALASDADFRERKAQFPEEASWWSYSKKLGTPALNLLQRLHRAMPTATGAASETQETLSTIATAVEAFIADHQTAPPASNVLDLEASLTPTYLSHLPAFDAWGTPIGYAASGAGYALWSLGVDHHAERDWSGCTEGCDDAIQTTSDDAQDIVLARGQFIRWPEERAADASATMSVEVLALAAALDARFAQMPASIGVMRKIPGALTYESLAPIDFSLSILLGIGGGRFPGLD